MNTSTHLDDTDRAILDLLMQDARRSITDIALRVNLSAAPVKRRIDRLEKTGVISGYTAVIAHDRLDAAFDAFTELRFAGSTAADIIASAAMAIPEVVEVFTIAGDPDALARIRVRNVQHLRKVVDELRRLDGVTDTKTLMVLGVWRRDSRDVG